MRSRGVTEGAAAGLAIAGVASIVAGVIHATAAGAHSEHRSTVVAFALLAGFQVGWGTLALAVSQGRRWIALAGAAGNAVAFGGWVLAKTSGIGFVTGLEDAESPQFADTLAAGLALVAVAGAVLAVTRRFSLDRRLVGAAAVVAVALGVPGMVSAGSHSHAGGHEHEESATPTKPYDATLPVDFSGVEGITAEQQAEAEELATITIQQLPQWADPATAAAAGFVAIGDADTGFEHYINWPWIEDDTVLDPNRPESLVYKVEDDERTLVAAMFMLPDGTSLDDVPDTGGDLIQWHVHDDLCFTGEENAWMLAGDGPVPPDEECPPGTSRLTESVPMIHVWIVPHACGAFASLEGVAAGQVAAGEERACDHTHGSTDPDAIGNAD